MNGFVAGGWGATAGMLAVYSWHLTRRGRLLARVLPPARPEFDDGPVGPAALPPERTGTGQRTGTGHSDDAATGDAGRWR